MRLPCESYFFCFCGILEREKKSDCVDSCPIGVPCVTGIRMKKKFFVVCAVLVVLGVSFAEDAEPESPWDFSITTDFAYYPKSDTIPSAGGGHFAPLTGLYGGVKLSVTGTAGYTIPVPFGDNPLVSGNKLRVYGQFELSPVSIAPGVEVSFSPVAFLSFSAGSSIGIGWTIKTGSLKLQGIAAWNPLASAYDDRTFKSVFWEAWFQGAFMFDFAAVKPGDWNHLVAYAAYKSVYQGITSGGENGNPWLYQLAGEKINGWQYSVSFIAAYQMPLVLQTVGVQTELSGQLNGTKDFASRYHSMNPNFTTISISPIMVFEFSKKDSLTLQFKFASRRSYTEKASAAKDVLTGLRQSGREWYFNRIALSYRHGF